MMRAPTTVRARGKGRRPKASNGGTRIAAKARTQSETARTNFYDEVTARIVAELEAGRFPWVQPWGNPDGDGSAVSPGSGGGGGTGGNCAYKVTAAAARTAAVAR